MKLIRAFAVTSASLTSDVLETPPSAYNAGTTYADGNQVSVFSGTNNTTATMYESLAGSNTGNTPSSSPSWWKPLGTAYLAYNAGTNYSAGAIVTDTTNHLLYESLLGSNTGNALTNASWWLEISPSNKWAMFDAKVSTQTTWASPLEFTIDATGRVDTVALLNIDAASANITVMDGVTEAYNETYSLTSTDGITSWFAYFFEPIERVSDLVVTDIPNVLDPSITVTMTDSDDVVIGHFVCGLSRELGGAQYGASVGIADYSRKVQDDFGNWSIVERGFSKRGRFDVWMEREQVDPIHRLLSQYRATPVLLVGAEDYTSTYIFGLLKDWNITISYPSHSVMQIEMEGL
jgi:hypothetical protein